MARVVLSPTSLTAASKLGPPAERSVDPVQRISIGNHMGLVYSLESGIAKVKVKT